MVIQFYKKILFYFRLRISRGSKILKYSKNPYNFSNFEKNIAKNLKKNNLYSSDYDKVYYQYIGRSLLFRLKKFYLYNLYTNRKIIFPLPKEWIKSVEKDLLKVNKFLSNFLYILYSILLIPTCVKTILKIIFSKSKIKENSIILADINNFNSLSKKNDYNLLNIIKENFDLDYDIIYHSFKTDIFYFENKAVSYSDNFFPLNLISKFKLILWFLLKMMMYICKSFFLKPKSLIIFKEEILSKQITYYINSNGVLARKYFFFNHSLEFRPLWTYHRQIKNRIIMINEPSSFYGFKNFKTSEYPKQTYAQVLSTWSNQLLFNEAYSEYIKKLFTNFDIKIGKKPKINIQDNLTKNLKVESKKFYVSIFDITPVRKYLRAIFLPQDNYRTGKVSIKFIEDIVKLSKELKFEIIWKQKRNKNLQRDDKFYWYIAEKYKKYTISPNYSAQKIASLCDISICAPFTSAAFYANKNGKINSIFYDPTSKIFKDDRGAQSQKIFNNYNDLKIYLQSLILNNK